MGRTIPPRILCLIPWLTVVCVVIVPAPAQYSGGSGEPNDPYRIATAADLIALGEAPGDYDKRFVMTADIDLDPNLPGRKVFDKAVIAPLRGVSSSVPWDPPFTGVFDGNDHTIHNMTIKTGRYLGLFGGLGSAARIVDLALDAVNVNGTGGYVGGLVAYSFGSITNCYSAGTVRGDGYAGGLVGYNNGGSLTNCRSTAAVGRNSYIGGLLGYNRNGNVTNCYSSGTVAGNEEVGGLVGDNGGIISNSCSISAVSGNLRVGGLVGSNSSLITNSYSAGAVSGDRLIGGLVGGNGDCIINCYSTGTVTGNSRVGGLVGYTPRKLAISCFWDIQTSGRTTSPDGVGLTTAEMQDIGTYLSAGWDLVDESLNGIADCWQMSPGTYPILRYLAEDRPAMPEGSGTAEDPYLIRDAWGLGTVWLEPCAHYRLETAVDLTGITWSIAAIPWFGGSFDGNDCVISNLHIQGERYLGLVGKLGSQGAICDLGLEAVDVNGLGNIVGSLAGSNFGRITNCYSMGTVTGGRSVGGLVGVGIGNVTACYSTTTVSGDESVGGLVGYFTGRISKSHSGGTIGGNRCIGGLVGDSYKGRIIDCYNTGSVTGTELVGGLLGAGYSSVPASYVATSYNTGLVWGRDHVGGLVGYSCGSVSNSYSTGRVHGVDCVGGLVGTSSGSISNCYSTGKADGNWSVGGLLASNTGEVLDSFWDAGSSGQTSSDGGTGKTATEMQTAGTFLGAGWDFVDETANGTEDIWWILEGQDYPRLWWEAPGIDY